MTVTRALAEIRERVLARALGLAVDADEHAAARDIGSVKRLRESVLRLLYKVLVLVLSKRKKKEKCVAYLSRDGTGVSLCHGARSRDRAAKERVRASSRFAATSESLTAAALRRRDDSSLDDARRVEGNAIKLQMKWGADVGDFGAATEQDRARIAHDKTIGKGKRKPAFDQGWVIDPSFRKVGRPPHAQDDGASH